MNVKIKKAFFTFFLVSSAALFCTEEQEELEQLDDLKEFCKTHRKLLIPLYNPETKETVYKAVPRLLGLGGVTVYVNTTTTTGAAAITEVKVPTHEAPPPGFFSLSNFTKNYLYVAGGSILFTYVFLYYKLKKAIRLLEDADAWCNWKGNVSLEKLFTFSQEGLADELLIKIQSRYANPRTPSDLVAPLGDFLESYRREIDTFRQYIKIAQWLKRLRMAHLFPIRNEDIFTMKERTQRLAFLKTLFFLWTTHHTEERERPR